MFNFSWFKSPQETPVHQQWEGQTMTMQQPSSPSAPMTEVISEQPSTQNQMSMNLRGGGEGADICCGVCAGLACFECCEDCC